MDQPLDTKTYFAPKKGKQATKGQKQIYKENLETMKFYSILASASLLFRFIVGMLISNPMSWLQLTFSLGAQVISIAVMYSMVTGGTDLNLKGGFADYLKDLILTTAFCTGLSVLSSWTWLLWLWLPGYWVYKVWTSLIAPWIFAPAPEVDPEVAEKKRKKNERKMVRAGYR